MRSVKSIVALIKWETLYNHLLLFISYIIISNHISYHIMALTCSTGFNVQITIMGELPFLMGGFLSPSCFMRSIFDKFES